MLTIDIPGVGERNFDTLILDFNGTIACDGELLPGVAERLDQLKQSLDISVITADTHGSAAKKVGHLPVSLIIIPQQNQDQAKRDLILQCGPDRVIAIGNGLNDALMLKKAVLGIALMQQEGVAITALQSADILVSDINAALDLLLKPKRLIATLRN